MCRKKCVFNHRQSNMRKVYFRFEKLESGRYYDDWIYWIGYFFFLKSLITRAVDISTLWPTLASWSHDHVRNHDKIYIRAHLLWKLSGYSRDGDEKMEQGFQFCQKCSICKLFSPNPDFNCACSVRGNHCIIIFSMHWRKWGALMK